MASRLSLHEELKLFADYVYFQPPRSTEIKYDCIRYSKDGMFKQNANNKAYMNVNRYQVIFITKNPDSDIPDKIIEHFPMCTFDRFYTADGLNHFVFTLYY